MWPLVEIGLAVGVLTTLVTVVSLCVCGCKNSNQKASAQNSQRSLPEIPQPVGRHDSGDTASEIYATVNLDEGGPKDVILPSTSREHPYEHAYAKLQNENNAELPVEQQPFAVANGDVQHTEHDPQVDAGPESVVISASVAISGQLPSSQELPYITPPTPSPLPHPEQNPQHFSGDSTDSAKGYTSISVREPLSNIRAATQSKPLAQPHYATVSDDSDEMYAAIEDPTGSAGGSETYAQIAPQETRRSLDRDPTPRASLLPSDANARRSAPPEIGAASNNSNHSRQASASSCTNSVGTLGSPKPEKRQANSPLPPPPAVTARPSPLNNTVAQRQQRISSTGDLHFSHDKLRRSLNEKHQRNNSCVSSSDFYGCNYPVDKHRFSSSDLIRPLVAKELNFDIDTQPDTNTDNLYNSIDGPCSADPNINVNKEHLTTESPSKNVEEMYAKVMKKAKSKLLSSEDLTAKLINYAKDATEKEHASDDGRFNMKNPDDPGYETIERKKSLNHGYETIAHKARKTSQNQDPGYETVKDLDRNNGGNFRNNNLQKLSNLPLDSGPNSMLNSDPGYEHIAKTDNSASDSDPNYEVLRNQPPTPPYATISSDYKLQPTYSVVNKKPGKYNEWSNNNDEGIIEPNYESMPNDPIYTTGSESDPNYESVRPKNSNYESFNNEDPNYESLKRKDPNYESVRSRDSKYESVRPNSKFELRKDPNYESVRSKDPNYESVRSKEPNYESLRPKDPKYESVRPKDPNYESVKYFDVANKEPPYEKLHAKDNNVERSDSAAGYERINPLGNKSGKSSINGADGTVSDYFHV